MELRGDLSVARNGMPVYYVQELELTNYRKFEHLEIAFARRFTLLIGRNGAGKSSIMGALAVVLSDLIPDHSGRRKVLLSQSDVRVEYFGEGTNLSSETQFPARVRTKAVLDGSPTDWQWTRTLRQTASSDYMPLDLYQIEVDTALRRGEGRVMPLLANYGVGRLSWETPKKTEFLKPGSRYQALTNALDASRDFGLLLRWLKSHEYDFVRNLTDGANLQPIRHAVSSCVEGATDLFYDLKTEELLIKIDARWLSLSHASSGYKQFIMLVASLAWRATMLNPSLSPNKVLEVPGVVVIDEIDAHLHPEWQRRVVYDLMKVFPNVQFIASTHSPFVIQAIPPSDETRIVRLDDLKTIKPEPLTLEEVAEYVQQVSNVDVAYPAQKQSERIVDALDGAETNPERATSKLDRILEEEPFDPATRALLELERLALHRSGQRL